MTSPTAIRTVAEHRAVVLDGAVPTPVVDLPCEQSLGLVLAEDVTAAVPLPGFDNSAMDGYAVRLADLTRPLVDLAGAGLRDLPGADQAAPVRLPVSDDIAAGAVPAGPLAPGTVARIMTGAPVPDGADAIVPVEDTDGGTEQVTITALPSPGAHIRRQGEDAAAGSVVLTAGTTVTAPVVGLLAAVGRTHLRVHRRPRVVLLSTGAELVPAGRPLPEGAIHDSNGPMLAAELTRWGAEVHRPPVVSDTPGALRDAVLAELDQADLVVTTAGVSAGAYDVVKADLAGTGDITFATVAMQPGKPQGSGHLGPDRVPIVTLPGNPVSSWVSAQVFLRPLVDVLLGRRPEGCPIVSGRLTVDVTSPAGRAQYVRATAVMTDPAESGPAVDVTPLGGPGSHLLASLALADALLVVPAEVTALPAGARVDVLLPHGLHTPPKG